MEFLYCFFPEEAIKKIDEEENLDSSNLPIKEQDEKDSGTNEEQKNNNTIRWRFKEEVNLKPDEDLRCHYKTSMTIPANPDTDETMYKSEIFFFPKTNETSEFSTTVYIYPKAMDNEQAFIALDEDLVDSVLETGHYLDIPAVKKMDEMEWTWSRRMYAALAQH